MLRFLPFLLLASAALPLSAQPLETPVGFAGPTGTLQQTPLRAALVDVRAHPSVARPWLRVERSTANVWNSQAPFRTRSGVVATHAVDAQVEGLFLDAGLPLGRWVSVGGRWGVQQLWGGRLVDEGIEAFHHRFDFYNFSRHLERAGRTELRAETDDGGPGLHWMGPRTLLASPTVSAFLRPLENETTSIQVRGDLLLPLGDVSRALRLYGPEAALGVTVWRRFWRVAAVYVGGHALFHGQAAVAGLTPRNPQLLGEMSLELRVLPFATLLLEDRVQSPLYVADAMLLTSQTLPPRATAYNAYFTPVNLISGGARFYFPTRTVVTLWVGEDFMLCQACRRFRWSRETNAPDVSLTLTVEQLFGPPGPR
ncbi:MAG: hypothetical protein HY904_01180 [Deltaproteobacteria bacterium]|nr:hypothetical protein [Deltaproteobacteria bacterium]